MLIVPVNVKHQIDISDRVILPSPRIPIRSALSFPILEQLGLLDLKDDIYVYSATMEPKSKIKTHKDIRWSGNWSLVIPPIGHEDVDIEIVSIREGAEQDEDAGLTSIGTPGVSYLDDDCILVESWNLKYGACYFNPTDNWHRAVNNTDQLRIIYSIRSMTLGIDEILNRIT
jgi:hypothetical protein